MTEPVTTTELKRAIAEVTKHVTKCFDDAEKWNHQRMLDHEAQERLMIEPIRKLLEKHEKMLMNPSALDPGLSLRVDRLEEHKRGQKASFGVIAGISALNFLELIKRLVTSV